MLSRASVHELDALYGYLVTLDEGELESQQTVTELVETLIVICRREGGSVTDDVRLWAMAKHWPGFQGTERACLRLAESADIVHHTLRLTRQLPARSRRGAAARPAAMPETTAA